VGELMPPPSAMHTVCIKCSLFIIFYVKTTGTVRLYDFQSSQELDSFASLRQMGFPAGLLLVVPVHRRHETHAL
jgi:hypothetical protein